MQYVVSFISCLVTQDILGGSCAKIVFFYQLTKTLGTFFIKDKEMDTAVPAYIQQLTNKQKITSEEARKKLRRLYDDYHFLEESPHYI